MNRFADEGMDAAKRFLTERHAVAGPPDIVVEDLKIHPYPEGGLYQATASFRNRGAEPCPTFRVYFYKDDPERKEPMVHGAGPIAPGEVWHESTLPFSLKEGTITIVVAADPDNAVPEPDETNNEMTTVYKAGGLPDIVIDDMRVRPYPEGGLYTVVTKLRNKGAGPCPKVRVYFYKNDPDCEKPMDHGAGPLEPGKVWRESTMPFGLQEGRNVIVAVADSKNEAVESDETNNGCVLIVVVKDGVIENTSIGEGPNNGGTG